MKQYELMHFPNSTALAQVAALAWLEEIEKSDRAGKRYCVAVSGGRITRDFFSAVVRTARDRKTSFHQTHFFWTDERCVPPSDPESNFCLASELLFDPLNIAPHQIHRVLGEEAPETAATAATEELRNLAPSDCRGIPVLDMIFLGLGEDAHVASLFPGDEVSLSPGKMIYRAISNSPKPPPSRVTLDYPVIAAARKVWMLASGKGKEKALRDSLSPRATTPFARVLHSRSDTRVFSDISIG